MGTPRFDLPYLFVGQAQKEAMVNEALLRLDALVHLLCVIMEEDVPAMPTVGEAWIVPAGAAGAWFGRENAVAFYTEGGWRFVVPAQGVCAWIADMAARVRFEGASWQVERSALPANQSCPAPVGGLIVDEVTRQSIVQIQDVLRRYGMALS